MTSAVEAACKASEDYTLEQDSLTPTNGWKAYYATRRAIVNINSEVFNIARDKSIPAISLFFNVKCIHASGELIPGTLEKISNMLLKSEAKLHKGQGNRIESRDPNLALTEQYSSAQLIFEKD